MNNDRDVQNPKDSEINENRLAAVEVWKVAADTIDFLAKTNPPWEGYEETTGDKVIAAAVLNALIEAGYSIEPPKSGSTSSESQKDSDRIIPPESKSNESDLDEVENQRFSTEKQKEKE